MCFILTTASNKNFYFIVQISFRAGSSVFSMGDTVRCKRWTSTSLLFCNINSFIFDTSGKLYLDKVSRCISKRTDIHSNYFHLSQVFTSSMFVASMAFFAKISDPAVGGTYMTLLNTLCNLGGNWPGTAALWFVDSLTFRQCSTDPSNDCSTITEREVGRNIKVP